MTSSHAGQVTSAPHRSSAARSWRSSAGGVLPAAVKRAIETLCATAPQQAQPTAVDEVDEEAGALTGASAAVSRATAWPSLTHQSMPPISSLTV